MARPCAVPLDPLDQPRAEVRELRLADAAHVAQLVEALGPQPRELAERGIVKDDVRGHAPLGGDLAP